MILHIRSDGLLDTENSRLRKQKIDDLGDNGAAALSNLAKSHSQQRLIITATFIQFQQRINWNLYSLERALRLP